MNDDDATRDGGCSSDPQWQSDCHCDAHLDKHQVAYSRGNTSSTNRDMVTEAVKQAGMMRPGKTAADYAVYE